MISIVIPTYLQPIHGGTMLVVLLNSIIQQQPQVEFEVVISDNDDTGEIKRIVDCYVNLPIRYFHNPIKGASNNFNNGIDRAKYDRIKLMCMDDAFVSRDAIDIFYSALDQHGWAIGNSVHINESGHVYGRRYTKYIHGNVESNITGMPSVVAFRKCDVRFAPDLKTVCDMFFYYGLGEKYGQPKVINKFAVACRFWRGSYSQTNPSRKKEEAQYLKSNGLVK